MNYNKSKLVGVFAAVLAVTSASSVSALTVEKASAVKRAIAGVPTVEVSAKAVELVSQASAADREEVAAESVKAAAVKGAMSVRSVVSTLTTVYPSFAPTLVAAGVEAAPDQAEAIAKAVTSAAPQQGGAIVAKLADSASTKAGVVSKAVEQTTTEIAKKSTVRSNRSAAGIFVPRPPIIATIPPRVVFSPVNPSAYFLFGRQFPAPTLFKSVNSYAAGGSDPNRP